ncbi:MAG: DUF6580 family putative transport protein [Pseudomonadota bacterium]
MIQNRAQPIYLMAIVLLLALSRLIPHPPNAVPIAAMALFAGAFFANRWLAYAIPIAAMLISDWLIGFHSTIAYVYIGVVVTVLIGSGLKKINVIHVGLAAVIASLAFFFITNFGAWLHHDLYTPNFNGLMQSYIAGLPFLRNALIANIIFSYLVFFGFSNLFANFSALNKSHT